MYRPKTAMLELLNTIEGIYWLIAGLLAAGLAIKRKWDQRGTAVLVVALVFFGISDFVEVDSGAWWRPWWLLVWKGACLALIGFGILMIRKRAASRATDRDRDGDPTV